MEPTYLHCAVVERDGPEIVRNLFTVIFTGDCLRFAGRAVARRTRLAPRAETVVREDKL